MNKQDEDDPDLLSLLPDELLASIFSRLPMEEAARTSVLSHRLNHVWNLNTGTLCFDDKKIEGWPPSLIRHILDQHRPSFVHSLCVRICQSFKPPYNESAHEWLLFAMNKSVRNLVLVILPVIYVSCSLNPRAIFFPFPTVNALKNLIKGVKNGHGFNFLTSLSIGGFHVNEGTVEYLVSICPCLQRLRLSKLLKMKHLKLQGPLPSFKHLEILHCETLRSLEISSISLLTLVYYGCNLEHYKCSDDTNISALTVGQFCSSRNFKAYTDFSGQRISILNFHIHVRWNSALLVLPAWRGLEQLDIRACTCHTYGFLHCCINVIKNCPSLKRLKLGLGRSENHVHRRVRVSPSLADEEFCNESLEVVEFNGFRGTAADLEIVKWLVRHGSRIQRIIVDLNYPSWIEDDDSYGLIYSRPAEIAMAKPGLEKLKAELPSNIELIVKLKSILP